MNNEYIIKLPEREVLTDDPFKYCILERKKYAEILTNIIDKYGHKGCVLSLNGTWGSGKTTFSKMWTQYLKNNDHLALYFNAWESDFCTDPMIAMIYKMKELDGDINVYKKLTDNIINISKNIIPDIIQNKTGIDLNKLNNLGDKFINEYSKQKESLSEFKNNLTQYISSRLKNHPAIFIIDELDRCNPIFAVRLLERIKHLFDIPNIVFILAINKNQLEYSIKGYFGSNEMDAKEYLRRFIDIEYTLPEPDMKKYCSYLYKTYNLDNYINNEERITEQDIISRNEKQSLLNISYLFSKYYHLNLRLLNKIFGHFHLIINILENSSKLYLDILFILCLWKVSGIELYNIIKQAQHSPQELLNRFENDLPYELIMNINKDTELTETISKILYMYSIYYEKSKNVLQYEAVAKEEFTNLKFEKINNKEILKYRDLFFKTHKIEFNFEIVIEKIELLSPLEFK